MSLSVLEVLAVIWAQGAAFLYISAMTVIAANFKPKDRGKALGVLLASYSLSTAWYTAVTEVVFLGHSSQTATAYPTFGRCTIFSILHQSEKKKKVPVCAERGKGEGRG